MAPKVEGRRRDRLKASLLNVLGSPRRQSRSPLPSSSTSSSKTSSQPNPLHTTLSRLMSVPNTSVSVSESPRHAAVHVKHAQHTEDLWARAYDQLQERDPELVTKFETCLLESHGFAQSAHGLDKFDQDVIREIISKETKKREANKWVVQLLQKRIAVRDIYEKLIKFVVWSDGIIRQAVRAEPMAALAWSIVSATIPVCMQII